MRAGLALAILIGTTWAALADGAPVIVIPGRPGVPIIINGVDASYAVVEGDWGLGKGVHVHSPRSMAAATLIPRRTSVTTIRAPVVSRATGDLKSNRRPTAGCRSPPRAIINPGPRSPPRSRCSPRYRFIRHRLSSRRKTVTPACRRISLIRRGIFGIENPRSFHTKTHADKKQVHRRE